MKLELGKRATAILAAFRPAQDRIRWRISLEQGYAIVDKLKTGDDSLVASVSEAVLRCS